MSQPVIEHAVDCRTGNAVDRDFEGVRPVPNLELREHEKRCAAALERLKTAAVSDLVLADLLLVMGVTR